MKQKALFVYGGWEGHKPKEIVQLFSGKLEDEGYETVLCDSLDSFEDESYLKSFNLLFPCWTMGALSPEATTAIRNAVHAGVGLGGIHGGMGDAFRGNLDYEWLVGGHFVGHPSVGEHVVRITDRAHPITEGLPGGFRYNSELYYMLLDPANHVLADLEYLYEGEVCRMPVAWTKGYGKGRIFYNALGHTPQEFTDFPEALRLTLQGLKWATGTAS